MAKPTEIDEYFLMDIGLMFLLINYNLPLATIYSFMVVVGSLMYIVPIQFNLFRWIPFTKPNGITFEKVLWGLGIGAAFIFFYNIVTSTPMATVFATTAFGDSKLLTKFVFSLLIPIAETRFFFRTILQWFAWKMNWPASSDVLSAVGIKLMVYFAAIFTIFHATAKGVVNTPELFATFIFGALSVGMILYFQEVIQAAILHIVVNSKSMGLFEMLKELAATSAGMMIFAGVVVLIFIINKRRVKIPFLA